MSIIHPKFVSCLGIHGKHKSTYLCLFSLSAKDRMANLFQSKILSRNPNLPIFGWDLKKCLAPSNKIELWHSLLKISINLKNDLKIIKVQKTQFFCHYTSDYFPFDFTPIAGICYITTRGNQEQKN